ITVKDVWRGVLPEGTELLAGGGGLERRVEWACALRTRPPAFDAVKGGEIAFVPVRSIKLIDERLDLAQVMTSFAEKGGVALAVLGDVSAESIDIADRLVMPLLRLPDSQHIADAHHACVRFILDQRTLLHERAQELQTTLMQMALSGAGAATIVERIAGITSLVALWLDEQGAVSHGAGGGVESLLPAVAEARGALRRWGDTSTVSAAERAERLVVDLRQPFAVITVRGGKQVVPGFEETALRAVRNLVAHRDAGALVAGRSGAVCAVLLLGDGGDAATARLAEAIRVECTRVTGHITTSLGMGRAPHGPAGVRASFREAEQALAMGRR